MKNIRDFKKGDIVTRVEPCGGDGSYMGDQMEYVGIDEESKLIFLVRRDHIQMVIDLSFGRGAWDEGWAVYPTKLSAEAEKALKTKK